jgi:hypothetical protein
MAQAISYIKYLPRLRELRSPQFTIQLTPSDSLTQYSRLTDVLNCHHYCRNSSRTDFASPDLVQGLQRPILGLLPFEKSGRRDLHLRRGRRPALGRRQSSRRSSVPLSHPVLLAQSGPSAHPGGEADAVDRRLGPLVARRR